LASFRVGRIDSLPPGKMIGAKVDGQKILVANIGGELYAMGSECNHMGGQLDKGKLEGSVVTCPRHGSRWDVKTGKLVQFPKNILCFTVGFPTSSLATIQIERRVKSSPRQ